MPPSRKPKLTIHPLTMDRWDDFVELFGTRGACGGCWCMTPRLTRREYEANKGAGNKRKMKALVRKGQVPGVLGYCDGAPIGWCSIEPRESFSALERSRVCKPVDDKPVWSIVCFFLAKPYRRQGLSRQLIKGAVKYARSRGARIVEAYPVEPKKDPMPEVFAYHGIAAAFRKAGFREVARGSETRPIMRKGR